MSRKILAFGIPVLLAFSAGSTFAVPTLTLESGSSTVTRTDGLDGALDGKIQFFGTVGNFTFNKVTAITDPIFGAPASPDLNLISLDVSSGLGGQLTVTFTDDGFTGSPLNLMATIGGTTGVGDSVQLLTYVNGTLLTDSGILGGPAFDNAEFASLINGSPYSLTLKAVITHSGGIEAHATSFGARLQTTVPDGGSTAVILGLGLLGLGTLRRSRNS